MNFPAERTLRAPCWLNDGSNPERSFSWSFPERLLGEGLEDGEDNFIKEARRAQRRELAPAFRFPAGREVDDGSVSTARLKNSEAPLICHLHSGLGVSYGCAVLFLILPRFLTRKCQLKAAARNWTSMDVRDACFLELCVSPPPLCRMTSALPAPFCASFNPFSSRDN